MISPDTPITILTVDDSRVSRMMITSLIHDQHPKAEILGAAEGETALRIIDERQSDLHLIILDMNMPGMTGLQVAEQALKKYSYLNFALLTGDIQLGIQKQAQTMNIRFFKKPIDEIQGAPYRRMVRRLRQMCGRMPHRRSRLFYRGALRLFPRRAINLGYTTVNLRLGLPIKPIRQLIRTAHLFSSFRTVSVYPMCRTW